MKIEEIFKNSMIDYSKLESFGFQLKEDGYYYQKVFCNNSFQLIVTISKTGKIQSKIIDLDTNEEYININTSMNGEFVNKVRSEGENILKEIKDHCFIQNSFSSKQANRISKWIYEKYGISPEFLWEDTPNCGVFRKKENQKWFGIIMEVEYKKLLDKNGVVDIINVKLKEEEIQELIKKKGYYKAYHMNKKYWITILLDETLSDDEILDKIEKSYHNIK